MRRTRDFDPFEALVRSIVTAFACINAALSRRISRTTFIMRERHE